MARPELVNDRTIRLGNGKEVPLSSGLFDIQVGEDRYTTFSRRPNGKIRQTTYNGQSPGILWVAVTDPERPVVIHADQKAVDFPDGTVRFDHPVGYVLAVGPLFAVAYMKTMSPDNEIIALTPGGAEVWRRRGDYYAIDVVGTGSVFIASRNLQVEEIDIVTGDILSSRYEK